MGRSYMINLKTFRPLSNYVLIKPDDHLTSYQVKGRELGLLTTDFKYEKGERVNVKERNASVLGTVYAVPQSLTFNLSKIKELQQANTVWRRENEELVPTNFSVLNEVGNLMESSVMFDVDMELEVGDRVNFSYQAHKKADDNKMVVKTKLGDMYLIKYDMIYMTVSEDKKPKKMINGWMIVEPEEVEIKKEGGQEFIEHTGGLVTLVPKNKFKKNRRNQIGKIVNIGARCRGYLQLPDKTDCIQRIDVEEKVIYDPRIAQKMEYETHQIMSDKVLHLIHRKDIYFICEKGFDLKKLSFEKRRMANV